MQERGIQYIKPKELYAQYVNYTKESLQKKPLEYHPFTVQLEQIGIKILYNIRYCGVRTNYYNVEYAALKEISDKYKWIHKSEIDNGEEEEVEHDPIKKSNNISNQKEDEIMSLKRKIAEYEKQSEPPEPIAIPVLPAEEAPKKRPRIVTKKKAATKVFNPIIEFHAPEPKHNQMRKLLSLKLI
jgi:hypothetical protein